ncbi:hypothetical protein AABV98_000310 [Enterobacter hormaechei]|uniref:tail fiber/spike domain-containing protein n=1 Tax=Enterobacter hormaechei TaxID=158836 RepID=UPI00079767DE|nr:hypothetical protein [Enterobacter hormaechei]SAI08457.1 T7 tail fiber protein [Enterobacter hormaechei]
MATQPTNLPVPSESPRDLKFNAGKIDEFVTSLVNTYVDRFGNEHYTIEGLRWLAQQSIAQYGWILVDSFQDGADITLPNQALRDEETSEYFRWDGALPKHIEPGSTPSSSGGIGIGAWISIGDASLRADIENGYLNPKYSRVYQTVADMKAGNLKVGDNVTWNGYYAAGDGGGNNGVVVLGPQTADDGSVFALSNGLYVAAIFGETADPCQFGISPTRTATQNTASFNAAISYGLNKKKRLLHKTPGSYLIDPIDIEGSSFDWFWWECGRGDVTLTCNSTSSPAITMRGIFTPEGGPLFANSFQYATVLGLRIRSPYIGLRYAFTENMHLRDLIFSGIGTTGIAIVGPLEGKENAVWDIIERIKFANWKSAYKSGVGLQSEIATKHVYVGDCTFRDWDMQNCGLSDNDYVLDCGYFDGGLFDSLQWHMNAASSFTARVHCMRIYKPIYVRWTNCYFWEPNGIGVHILSPRECVMDETNMIAGAGQSANDPSVLIANFDSLTSYAVEIRPRIVNGYSTPVVIQSQGDIDLTGIKERNNCLASTSSPAISLLGATGVKVRNAQLNSSGGPSLAIDNSTVEVFNIDYSGYASQATISNGGSISVIPANRVRQVSSASFVGVFDDEIQYNATSGGANVTLPSATNCPGKVIRIIKTDSSSNGVAILPASGNAINGASSYSLTAQYSFVQLRSTGANWIIIGKS